MISAERQPQVALQNGRIAYLPFNPPPPSRQETLAPSQQLPPLFCQYPEHSRRMLDLLIVAPKDDALPDAGLELRDPA